MHGHVVVEALSYIMNLLNQYLMCRYERLSSLATLSTMVHQKRLLHVSAVRRHKKIKQIDAGTIMSALQGDHSQRLTTFTTHTLKTNDIANRPQPSNTRKQSKLRDTYLVLSAFWRPYLCT